MGGLFDPGHCGDRLADDFTGLCGIGVGFTDRLGGLTRVFRTCVDLRGQLVERCGGLFEACGLTLGPLRKIRGAVGNLVTSGSDRVGRSRQGHDRFLQACDCRIEVGFKLGVLAGEIARESIGQIALRKLGQTVCQTCNDALLNGERTCAFVLGFFPLFFREMTLVLGDAFETDTVGKFVAEAFKRYCQGADFVLSVLARNRSLVVTQAEIVDGFEHRGQGALNQPAACQIEHGKRGKQQGQPACNHQFGLGIDLGADHAFRHIDEDDPAGVHPRKVEREDDAIERLALRILDAADFADRAVRQGLADGVRLSAFIGLHHEGRIRSHEPLGILRDQHHAPGLEGTDCRQLFRKRCK